MEHLDRYEREGIDDQFIDDVTEEERFAARLAAERELADRDVLEGRLTGRRRGLPAALEGAYLVGAVCVAGPRCCSLYRGAGWRTVEGTCRPPTVWKKLRQRRCLAEELDEDVRRPRRRRRLEEAQAGMDEDEDLVRRGSTAPATAAGNSSST